MDPKPPPKARFLLVRSAWRTLVAAAIGLPVAALLGAAALLHSPQGSALLLAGVPGLKVEGLQGALLGEHFSAERLRFSWHAGQAHVEIDGLAWHGARWRWWVRQGVWAAVQAESLTARRVVVVRPPSSGTPLTAPAHLGLPLEAIVDRVEVGALQIDARAPARALTARLHLGADEGRRHHVEVLAFQWDRLEGQGRADIDTRAPFDLTAQLDLRGTGDAPWTARADGSGPLASIQLSGRLRGAAPDAGRPAGTGTGTRRSSPIPALDAQLLLRPFEAWPLGTLSAQMQALDLATLATGAPHTALSGRAAITSHGLEQAVEADIELSNALTGPWNAGRLPVRRARIALRAHPTQADRLDLPAFEVDLASDGNLAGQWRGSGEWLGTTFKLDTRLTGLRPQGLDTRAAAATVSGPLALTLRGLPHPDPRHQPAPGATATARGIDLSGALDGTIDGLGQALSVAVDASVSALGLELRRLHAESGTARADLTADARRSGATWLVRSEGRLADFDPVAWFPGEPGSAWRQSRTRLNADWKLELAAPSLAPATGQTWWPWLQALQGEGALEIKDSRWAGVPLRGALRIGQDPRAARDLRSQVEAELALGANRLRLDGIGDPAGSGEGDQWKATVDAPALAELAPLAALHADLAPWAPAAGRVGASLTLSGRWPAVRTEGQATLEGVRTAALSVGRGSLAWRMDGSGGQPVELKLDLGDASWGPNRLALLRGDLTGTPRAHRARLEVAAPLQPPEPLARLLGLQPGAGTLARLDADGGWEPAATGGGRWQGALQALQVAVWDGSMAANGTAVAAARPASAPRTATWIDLRDLKGELQFGPDARLKRASAAAGQATLAGGVRLRWGEALYQAGGADGQRHDLDLRLEVEPFALAPMLQRAQTQLQWGGDLRLGARLDLRAGERLDADLVLRRHDGDLTVADVGSAQPLGLSELNLSLSAHDGVWRFTPLFSGQTLGIISGTVEARTSAQARWPGPEAPVEGALQAQVPNLGVWAGWIPPGWRIEGELATTARLGGRVGAPEYTGELRGSRIGVRNLLQGVALREGELLVALRGDNARIERMSLRGGDGLLRATGGARFGAQPTGELKVTAEGFRVLGRIDRQLVVSGQAALALQADRFRLDGRIGVDSGLFDLSGRDAPSLDEDVSVRRNGPAVQAPVEPAPAPRLMRNAVVALDVDLGRKLQLKGRGLDTSLQGVLKLSTPGGRLAVNGTVRAEDGTYAAYGQKMQIERGLVAFAGPLDSARLDILALRPNIDTRVGVAITGPTQAPRVRLYSEPEMSETDKLSWLVLGRGPEGLARTDTAVLQRAALALLAGEGEGPTDTLLRSIGLDDLSIRQSDGEVRETVISLGKQLGRRWYVGYERGVNATTGTWQLIYRVAQRFTLRAQSGQENSLDLIWTWRFDRP